MPKRLGKTPKQKDTQPMARSVLDQIAPDAEPPKKKRPAKKAEHKKDPAAVALGRKGGLVGGHGRAAKLTKEQLSESARKAAQAGWAAAKATEAPRASGQDSAQE
ncbi:MAG TPA: hypothetical protein VHY91_13965 [Pirellulales bacterium]|jgi:hypothetical protein|nr:hypothetical protein [Pirellulales bacterium]